MNRKEVIFNAFVRANGLQKQPDFRTHSVLYVGPHIQQAMTKEDIIGTVDFAGFVDGFEGRPCRVKSPKGTPDVSTHQIQDTLDRIVKNIDPTGMGIFGEFVAEKYQSLREESPERRYDRQYQLGRTESER